MPLTNAQYNSILRIFDEKQLRARRDLDERREAAYSAVPRLREIDGEIASMGKQIRRKSTDLNEMKKENAWFSGMNDEIQERYGQLELLIDSIKTSGD